MRLLRALCAALLLVAFTVGVPLHTVTAHGMAPHSGAAMQVMHAHNQGTANHHKPSPGALCQIACGAMVAVLSTPPRLGTQLAYAVQFAASPPAAGQGTTRVPDPFPPRPSLIA